MLRITGLIGLVFISSTLFSAPNKKIKAKQTYWILLENGTYLKGSLVILPDNNYSLINNDYLNGHLLKRKEIVKIGDKDFKALGQLPEAYLDKIRKKTIIGFYPGLLFLPGEASSIYGIGRGLGLFYQYQLDRLSKSLNKFKAESRLEYYNANSSDDKFGNLQLLRLGINLHYNIISFSFLHQGIDAFAGLSYGFAGFQHATEGNNTFNSLIYQTGLIYIFYAQKSFQLQLAAEAEFEKQSKLIISPKIGLRILFRI